MIDLSFLKIWDSRLVRDCSRSALRGSSRRSYEVTAPHDNFVNNSLDSISFRSELALLNRAFDKNVISLVECRGDSGKITVKRQVVPVGVLLWFAIRVQVSVALSETDIGDGRSGRKISGGGLSRQIADDFQAVFLHFVHSFSN